ncbi:MAG: CoB--CoM heterodisulfide reductase iron-sulfur subunit A family protein [Candidatus Schekmanbacteria bacterium]|nr:CoB--CoM heterodisulfide reductase iron-sulfur subunit A family protein [Candidatus Schekmanbacteria bacterium]
MKSFVAIIGGGIAGISAANELSREKVPFALIEKEFYAGGKSSLLCCKASEKCNRCSACVADHRIKDFFSGRESPLHVGSYLTGIEKDEKGFNINFKKSARSVIEEKCTSCGKCEEACPVAGKAIKLPPPGTFPKTAYIDKSLCLRSKGENCEICAKVCPENAVDYSQNPVNEKIYASSVILAVGFEHFNPRDKSSFHYGIFKNVISGQELEEALRIKGKVVRPSDGKVPSSIAYIQCAGSRDPKNTNPYCSQVCCLYAMRTALHIKEESPDTKIKIFYMDIQSDCKKEMEFYNDCLARIEMERSMPGNIEELDSGGILVTYESIEKGKNIAEEFDMVVLSTGIAATPANKMVTQMFGLKTDSSGFIESGDESERTKTKDRRIFIAGCCQSPKNISSSMAQGVAAARNAIEIGYGE